MVYGPPLLNRQQVKLTGAVFATSAGYPLENLRFWEGEKLA